MSPEMIGLIGIIAFVALVLLRVQVGIALLTVGLIGYAYLVNPQVALSQLGMSSFGTAAKYSLSVMPMFILMGMFLSGSGLAKDLFKAVDYWVGQIRGGLAMATLGASAIFASISGSNNATTATISKVALPEMKKYNYDMGLSAASVAAGGTLGVLIPPSVILILYGVLTMEPIGKLLIGGFVPGVLMCLVFMLTVYIQVRRNPELAPVRKESVSFSQKMQSLAPIWPFFLIFMISIGGIYFGMFTPTEAGAVGAFGALLFAVLTKRMNWKQFVSSIEETVRLTAMIFIILIGATLFGQFLAMSRIPAEVSSLVTGLDINKYVIMVLILFVYLLLGLFMEGIAILVLTLPIVHPLILDLGFDGVWFGIIMTLVFNIGTLTPPLGMGVFVIHGVNRDIPLPVIFKGVMPMIYAMIIFTIILVAFPDIVMFLPNMMK
jgi:tripartite ATP-independent transporter DctM subunit